MAAGIYVIRNLVNGKEYVGQSSHIAKRWESHRYNLRHGTHANPLLQAAWNKYGESAFAFEVLEVVEDERLLNAREHFHGEVRKPIYNVSPLGEAYTLEARLARRERARIVTETLRAQGRPFTVSDIGVRIEMDGPAVAELLRDVSWWTVADIEMSRAEGQRRGREAGAPKRILAMNAAIEQARANGFPALKRAQEVSRATNFAGCRAFHAKRRGVKLPSTHGITMRGEHVRQRILTLLREWYSQDDASGREIYGCHRIAHALSLRSSTVLHHLRILKAAGRIDEYNRPTDLPASSPTKLLLPQFARSAEIHERILLESAIWCEANPGRRLGCTTLARLVGATDQAVWKHLRALRVEGRIDGHNRPMTENAPAYEDDFDVLCPQTERSR